jgi:hypothetical protein
MSTTIIRPRAKDRERAIREGWPTTRFPWPEDAVSAYQNYPGAPWEFTTRADLLRERRKEMEARLRRKRRPTSERRALMVHVFYVGPPIFMGWWTYLVGIGDRRYPGGGHKHDVCGPLLARVRELFPLVLPGLPDDQWMECFARRFQKRTRFGKPEGAAPVWATVDGERVLSIDAAAEGEHE